MTTIIITALISAFVGFVIGLLVGVGAAPEVKSTTEQNTEPPAPVWVRSKIEPPAPVWVRSKIVLPKRISKAEYTKRVNACLKDAVTQAVNAYVAVTDKSVKRRVITRLYNDWHDRLWSSLLAYHKYDANTPRLDIVGRKVEANESDYSPYHITFYAVWSEKEPYDN